MLQGEKGPFIFANQMAISIIVCTAIVVNGINNCQPSLLFSTFPVIVLCDAK